MAAATEPQPSVRCALARRRAPWQQVGVVARPRTRVQRIALCAWEPCRAPLFSVCHKCDVGRRRYCSAECSAEARHRSVRAAGRRYQQTDQGRVRHAARQARYRERQLARVDSKAHHVDEAAAEPLALDPSNAESVAPGQAAEPAQAAAKARFQGSSPPPRERMTMWCGVTSRLRQTGLGQRSRTSDSTRARGRRSTSAS